MGWVEFFGVGLVFKLMFDRCCFKCLILFFYGCELRSMLVLYDGCVMKYQRYCNDNYIEFGVIIYFIYINE